jgi:hypothetical protein
MSRNRGKKSRKKQQHKGLLNFTFESVEPSKENMQQAGRPSMAFIFFKN